ncbi:GIP, partial [Symbiodinium microadriaticum]
VKDCSPSILWYHFDLNQKNLDYLKEIGEVQVRSGRKLIVETSSPPEAHWHRLITNLFKKYIVKAIPHGYKYEIHVFDPIRDGEAQEVWVAEHEGRDPMPPEAVFGKDPACPEELLCGRDEGQYLELVTEDRQRQKEIAIRNAAKAAFFRTQVDTKFRRSLLQRARVKHGAYAPGQMVCFFRIEKVATKRGQWRGPGLILGGEGGNWWISHGGRCYLTAEEHMRPATAEEIGDLMNSRVARADLEKLLAGDRDDPDNYDPDEEEPTEVNPGAMEVEDEDMNLDLAPGDPDPEGPEKPSDETPPYGPVRQRARTKKPQPHTANMLKKCQTERSREKQYEKEIPWSMIPPERHADFKAAEIKQLKEHYDLNAFTPLTKRESEEVYAETSKDRSQKRVPTLYARLPFEGTRLRRMSADNWEIGVETKSGHVSPRSVTSQRSGMRNRLKKDKYSAAS